MPERRTVMAAVAMLGAVVPYTAVAAFISQHGLDVGLLLSQVFSTPGSTFFALDVVMCAIAVLVALLFDWRQVRMPWLVAVATVAIGPSCGLPPWLALRRSAS